MRALIDTDVLLDAIFSREPFFNDSKKVFDLVCEKKINGCVSVQSLRGVFYFCRRVKNLESSFETVEKLSFIFEIIDVNGQDAFSVLMSDKKDFERWLLVFSAHRNYIESIITRKERDFSESDLIIINPKDIDQYIDTEVEVGSTIIG